jgi:hypothetical protein
VSGRDKPTDDEIDLLLDNVESTVWKVADKLDDISEKLQAALRQ